MDLASYLLKPIQRISKYNLLLRDMFKECSTAQEKECKELQGAHEIVCFQLRYGNDLLAMDDIQECDVSFDRLLQFEGILKLFYIQPYFLHYCIFNGIKN